jgi:hypothetical protein
MAYIVIETQVTVYGPTHILHMFRLGTSSSSGRITFCRHVICCYVDYDGWAFMGMWKVSDEVTLKCYVYFWALNILALMDFEKKQKNLNFYTRLQRIWVFTIFLLSNL